MAGLALASYGRGLMSPSYPSLYKRTFSSQKEFEKGYPINYSVNNIGAFAGQYFFPILVLYIGFTGGFILSAVMAAVALFLLVILQKPFSALGKPIDQKTVSAKSWFIFAIVSFIMVALVFFMFSNMDIGQNIVYAIGLLAIGYFISLMFKVDLAEKLRMGTILIMTFLTTCFFVYYGQMMTSMNIVVPQHIESFSVSLFSVAIALSGILGAALSTHIALEKGQVLTQQIAQHV